MIHSAARQSALPVALAGGLVVVARDRTVPADARRSPAFGPRQRKERAAS